jgi:hypothetical protein
MFVRYAVVLSLLLVLRAFAPGAAFAADPVELPAILSLTGPAAFIGGEEQKALIAIERDVNADGVFVPASKPGGSEVA